MANKITTNKIITNKSISNKEITNNFIIFAKNNDMNIPFNYGKIVRDEDFTDRVEETKRLIYNMYALTNTALISPRRIGKSSLVEKAIKEIQKSNNEYIFVTMTCMDCDDEWAFYQTYAKRIIECISTSAESLVKNAKDFVMRLIPTVAFKEPTGQYELSFQFNFKNQPDIDDILDLPQKIAEKKNKKVIVCIDEFQQIGEFKNTSRLQRKLRDSWQRHQNVAYILYGSKKHMMLNIFGEYRSPFFRFGDIMYLPKITNENWVYYITERFQATGKEITQDDASYLADKVENHPYYVQQLAQVAWLRTEKECNKGIIDDAFEAILDILGLQYENLMNTLTENQKNYLKAVCMGERNLSSARVVEEYGLGTTANVAVIKKALLRRDIIDVEGPNVIVQDTMLKYWIRKNRT